MDETNIGIPRKSRSGKRALDASLASAGLIIAGPILIPVMAIVWLNDKKSPFYIAPRVGQFGAPFQMVKLRSMVVGAANTGVDSTGNSDSRITPIGRFIRRYKLDELTQLWNVLRGDMSLVGPRPNVQREVDLYTLEERALLSVKPGITDFASIVFADEGAILEKEHDPDIAYNQLIRPSKSRLGLFYIQNQSLSIDLRIIGITAVAILSRKRALRSVARLLVKNGAPSDLVAVSLRTSQLLPSPPPGTQEIVTRRQI